MLPLRRAHGLKVFTAPLLVFLSEDTMMQPDIACLLPDSLARLTRDGIDGADSHGHADERHDGMCSDGIAARNLHGRSSEFNF
jgi:hypothetical protein